MLAELLATEGVCELVELRDRRVGFLALHGGSLERLTDVVARRSALASGSSFYGVVQPPSFRWHVPSVRFDPAESAKLDAFLAHTGLAISVHGYGRDLLSMDVDLPPGARSPDLQRCVDTDAFLVGGLNRAAAAVVADVLGEAFPEHPVRDELSAIPEHLRGTNARNPVNLTRAAGVQVEIPPDPRGLGPSRRQRVGQLVDALRRAAVMLQQSPGTWNGRLGGQAAQAC